MEDYKEVIKELLLRNFTPTGINPVFFNTTVILKMVQGIIPKKPISEHDVYEVLKELGFKQQLKTFYKKDKDGKDTTEIDYQVYLWVFYKK